MIAITQTELYRLCTLRTALRLEILGMKRGGQSVYSLLKKEFNLKGTKQKVLEQTIALIEREKAK